jgi:diadenosine tetraphosphate (Ap4A) HIT family hydrolase
MLRIFFIPDGFNIAMNIGEASGQTFIHFHLVSRYKCDIKNPKGVIKNSIPEKGNNTL